MSEGRIRKALSGFYYVDTGSEVLTCRARGKFRKEGISPLVGDRVEVRKLGNGEGFVEAILPRKNAFSRPAVANIDQLVVIASGAIPKTDPFLIDRVAAIAALKGCSVMVLLNKCDLDCADALYAIYAAAGFPTLRVSAETGEGIEELKPLIAGKLSAFTGNSGVGKSSILNALDPAFQLQVGDVSQALGRGRHTTRHVELFHLSCGADVVDSPGFSSFETDELNLELKHRLPETFVEFRPYLDQCRFVGCSHTKEKGCAVLEANAKGGAGTAQFAAAVRELLRDKLEAYAQKGQVGRVVRVMVLGIPNVGKSTFINKVARRKSAKAEDRPGVTRSKQWVPVDSTLELLDTPGILWPKFDDPEVGKRLAFTGAIKDDVLDIEELACYLMEYLGRHYTSVLEERYKIAVEPEDSGYDLLEKAGRKRGFLMRGAQVDTERMARILLDEFRGGKLGRFTLETVEDAT